MAEDLCVERLGNLETVSKCSEPLYLVGGYYGGDNEESPFGCSDFTSTTLHGNSKKPIFSSRVIWSRFGPDINSPPLIPPQKSSTGDPCGSIHHLSKRKEPNSIPSDKGDTPLNQVRAYSDLGSTIGKNLRQSQSDKKNNTAERLYDPADTLTPESLFDLYGLHLPKEVVGSILSSNRLRIHQTKELFRSWMTSVSADIGAYRDISSSILLTIRDSTLIRFENRMLLLRDFLYESLGTKPDLHGFPGCVVQSVNSSEPSAGSRGFQSMRGLYGDAVLLVRGSSGTGRFHLCTSIARKAPWILAELELRRLKGYQCAAEAKNIREAESPTVSVEQTSKYRPQLRSSSKSKSCNSLDSSNYPSFSLPASPSINSEKKPAVGGEHAATPNTSSTCSLQQHLRQNNTARDLEEFSSELASNSLKIDDFFPDKPRNFLHPDYSNEILKDTSMRVPYVINLEDYAYGILPVASSWNAPASFNKSLLYEQTSNAGVTAAHLREEIKAPFKLEHVPNSVGNQNLSHLFQSIFKYSPHPTLYSNDRDTSLEGLLMKATCEARCRDFVFLNSVLKIYGGMYNGVANITELPDGWRNRLQSIFPALASRHDESRLSVASFLCTLLAGGVVFVVLKGFESLECDDLRLRSEASDKKLDEEMQSRKGRILLLLRTYISIWENEKLAVCLLIVHTATGRIRAMKGMNTENSADFSLATGVTLNNVSFEASSASCHGIRRRRRGLSYTTQVFLDEMLRKEFTLPTTLKLSSRREVISVCLRRNVLFSLMTSELGEFERIVSIMASWTIGLSPPELYWLLKMATVRMLKAYGSLEDGKDAPDLKKENFYSTVFSSSPYQGKAAEKSVNPSFMKNLSELSGNASIADVWLVEFLQALSQFSHQRLNVRVGTVTTIIPYKPFVFISDKQQRILGSGVIPIFEGNISASELHDTPMDTQQSEDSYCSLNRVRIRENPEQEASKKGEDVLGYSVEENHTSHTSCCNESLRRQDSDSGLTRVAPSSCTVKHNNLFIVQGFRSVCGEQALIRRLYNEVVLPLRRTDYRLQHAVGKVVQGAYDSKSLVNFQLEKPSLSKPVTGEAEKLDQGMESGSNSGLNASFETSQQDVLETHSPPCIFIVGKTGSGKSLLARAIAWECRALLIVSSFTDIMKSGFGESVQVIVDLFKAARESSPCVLLLEGFDELKSLAEREVPETSVGGDDPACESGAAGIITYAQILGVLLQQIDSLQKNVQWGLLEEAERDSSVNVIFTTRDKSLVDDRFFEEYRCKRIYYTKSPTSWTIQDKQLLLNLYLNGRSACMPLSQEDVVDIENRWREGKRALRHGQIRGIEANQNFDANSNLSKHSVSAILPLDSRQRIEKDVGLSSIESLTPSRLVALCRESSVEAVKRQIHHFSKVHQSNLGCTEDSNSVSVEVGDVQLPETLVKTQDQALPVLGRSASSDSRLLIEKEDLLCAVSRMSQMA